MYYDLYLQILPHLSTLHLLQLCTVSHEFNEIIQHLLRKRIENAKNDTSDFLCRARRMRLLLQKFPKLKPAIFDSYICPNCGVESIHDDFHRHNQTNFHIFKTTGVFLHICVKTTGIVHVVCKTMWNQVYHIHRKLSQYTFLRLRQTHFIDINTLCIHLSYRDSSWHELFYSVILKLDTFPTLEPNYSFDSHPTCRNFVPLPISSSVSSVGNQVLIYNGDEMWKFDNKIINVVPQSGIVKHLNFASGPLDSVNDVVCGKFIFRRSLVLTYCGNPMVSFNLNSCGKFIDDVGNMSRIFAIDMVVLHHETTKILIWIDCTCYMFVLFVMDNDLPHVIKYLYRVPQCDKNFVYEKALYDKANECLHVIHSQSNISKNTSILSSFDEIQQIQ